MSDRVSKDSLDSQAAARFLAYEEALAAGRVPEELPADLPDNLRDGFSCLEMMARLWPGDRITKDQSGNVTPEAGSHSPLTTDHSPNTSHPSSLIPYPSQPRLPEQLGRFKIEAFLGAGGCGVVFLALDPNLKRRVALKVPRPEVLFVPELTQRFYREAETVARLDHHPNLVPVFEVDTIGPVPYMASRYCEGPTLASWIKHNQPVPIRLAARLVQVLADAVQHAHDKGIVHRDLKPGNVLLQPIGEMPGPKDELPFIPQITDFGLAKLIDTDSINTRSRAILGTPAYMAPEMADGRQAEVGPAADIFALGVILYEMLAGTRPFDGASDVEIRRKIIIDEPARLRKVRKEVPRDLETICLKCLEKAPNKRYASAAVLAAELGNFLAGKPILARRAGPLERAVKWLKRKPARAALVILSIVVVASGGTIAWYAEELKATADRERRQGEQDARKKEIAERERKERERQYPEKFRAAWETWHAGRQRLAAHMLDDLIPRDGEDDLRGFEWRFFHMLANRSPKATVPPGPGTGVLAISPDGKLLAAGRTDGRVSLFETTNLKHKVDLFGHNNAQHIYGLTFSPDGKLLASANPGKPGELKLWNVEKAELCADLPGRPFEALAFSPDGKTLAGAGAGEGLCLFSWNGSRRQLESKARTYRGRTDNYRTLVWHPSTLGPTAANVHGDIRTWDGKTGKPLSTLTVKDHDIWSLAMAPDGTTLASGSLSGKIIISRGNQRLQNLFPPVANQYRVRALAYSPDGKLLASGNGDGRISLWDTNSWELLDLFSAHGSSEYRDINSLVFSRDSKTLFSAGQLIKSWDIRASRVSRLLTARTGGAWWVVFAPDGQTVIAGGDDRTARVWETHTGHELAVLRGHTSVVMAGTLGPDGKVLATSDYGGTIRLWRKSQDIWQTTFLLPGHKGPVRGLAISPDSEILASCGEDATVRLWDIRTGQPRKLLNDYSRPVHGLAFHPFGQALATGGTDMNVKLRAPSTGNLLQTLSKNEKVRRLAYSPDGAILAIGTTDGFVRLRRTETDQELATLKAHIGDVRALAFSPDGTRLASGGEDKFIKLWHVNTGQELLTLNWHKGTISGLAFSPDGKTIASASHDGTVRLWLSNEIPVP